MSTFLKLIHEYNIDKYIWYCLQPVSPEVVYAEVDVKTSGDGDTGEPVIHGQQKQTIYQRIDFDAKPILKPDSDSD